MPAEIKPLTGVRVVAALWVVLFHLREWIPGETWVNSVIAEGEHAVPFFFILSGFILSHVYFPSYTLRSHGRFVWLRFARLWPLHAVMLLPLFAYVLLGVYTRGYVAEDRFNFATLPGELVMVRSWTDEALIWNLPAWSIQCEWFAYIALFPLCFLAFRALSSASGLIVLIVLLLAVHPWAIEALPGRIGSIACLFAAGSALYRLGVLMPAGPRMSALMALSGGSITVLGCVTGYTSILPPAFCLTVVGLSRDCGFIGRFLASRIMVYGGTISFAIYMTHYPFMIALSEAEKIAGVTAGPFAIAMVVAAMMGFAALAHRSIEKPANSWLRNVGRAQVIAPRPLESRS